MIESTGRVNLVWPLPRGEATYMHSDAPTLADVRRAFEEWLDEAKRRGCPDDAPVAVNRQGMGRVHHLCVIWDTGPPKITTKCRRHEVKDCSECMPL